MTTFTTEDRVQAEIEHTLVDAEDACIEFCDEYEMTMNEDEVWLFTEAFNLGQQAMKDKILTLLGGFK